MGSHGAGHPVVRALAQEGRLFCPRCREAALREDDDHFECANCAARFPVYNRVVDLHGLSVDAAPCADDVARAVALARPVTRALELPETEATIEAVTEVLGRTARMSAHHDEFDAEIRDIADRFGIEVDFDAATADNDALLETPRTVDTSVERHYIPQQMACGARLTGNVRFRNRGVESFSSFTSPPVHIGIRWFDARGQSVEVAGHRTRFPVVMTPGRAITLPVQIDVPPVAGVYTLVVCPVIEDRCWVGASGIAVSVAIQPSVDVVDIPEHRPDGSTITYAEDHDEARVALERHAANLLAQPGRRMLEIGGGAAPQVAWFGRHDVLNVDINLPLLELGSLWYQQHARGEVSERVAFLCADATDLPFAAESFDIIAMFSTLHHFPEPEVLLRECRRLLQPDGVIAVLCEPIGGSLESDDTLRDLAKGINEQIFSVAEYMTIFAAAGLEVVAAYQLRGLLRAFLRPGPSSGISFGAAASDAASLVNASEPRTIGGLWRSVKRRARRR